MPYIEVGIGFHPATFSSSISLFDSWTCLNPFLKLTLQIQNLELELEETKRISANTTGVGPSNDINGSNDSVVVHNLREELKKTKSELANAKEKLDISRLSNLNRLVEVATHREKVRDLEGDLEEVS
jgi:hypothetical protein